MNEHSRLDRDHYKNCEACYDDNLDLRQDIESDGGCDD